MRSPLDVFWNITQGPKAGSYTMRKSSNEEKGEHHGY
jgi:hypothetical protein